LIRLLQFLAWPAALGIIIALLAMLLLPNLRVAPATQTTHGTFSYADAVSRAAPAVVNIYTEKQLGNNSEYYLNPNFRRRYNTGNAQESSQKTLGSGVIVDASGLVLTNNHVINSADQILVLLNDGRYTSAELLGVDKNNDLAVLKINIANLTAINIGRSSKARVGDVVLAIGNPLGVGQSVSQGIISATGRWNLGINNAENFIQTDAAINPGNSGGALIDAQGQLIGINTAMLDESGSTVGISFAVPVDTAIKSLQQIVKFGEVRRGWLGIAADWAVNNQSNKALIVLQVEAGGPAEKAGIRQGDILTHMNGQPMVNEGIVANQLANLQPGDKVNFRVFRDNASIEITATAEFPPTIRTET
jgi:serine protease DegS